MFPEVFQKIVDRANAYAKLIQDEFSKERLDSRALFYLLTLHENECKKLEDIEIDGPYAVIWMRAAENSIQRRIAHVLNDENIFRIELMTIARQLPKPDS